MGSQTTRDAGTCKTRRALHYNNVKQIRIRSKRNQPAIRRCITGRNYFRRKSVLTFSGRGGERSRHYLAFRNENEVSFYTNGVKRLRYKSICQHCCLYTCSSRRFNILREIIRPTLNNLFVHPRHHLGSDQKHFVYSTIYFVPPAANSIEIITIIIVNTAAFPYRSRRNE